MSRRASRVDANQPTIVEALRKAGLAVLHLHGLGNDAPDLLVSAEGGILLEIKTERGKLTPGQRAWHDMWRVRGGRVAVVRTIEEAYEVCGVRTGNEHTVS